MAGIVKYSIHGSASVRWTRVRMVILVVVLVVLESQGYLNVVQYG